jgi:hypothetical protein
MVVLNNSWWLERISAVLLPYYSSRLFPVEQVDGKAHDRALGTTLSAESHRHFRG